MRTYPRRLAALGASKKGIAAYCYGLRATVRSAGRLSGCPVTMTELFRNATLLGRALVDDVGSGDGHQLSRWTLAQRRSAVRSFAHIMRPELLPLLGEEPRPVVERALRKVAERVGSGYRLSGGTPRGRGGSAPSREEVSALVEAVGRAPGFEGVRNQAFFGILAATGSRVSALRMLDGGDCVVLPDGRLRLFLHAKGKRERREVELGSAAASNLLAYVDVFNRHAAACGWAGRIRLGESGTVWRSATGRRWGYKAVLETLHRGCAAGGLRAFSPHALRRAFATDAASRLPRHIVAQAGGWKGLDRLDDHYVQARTETIWQKLFGGGAPVSEVDEQNTSSHAPASTVR